MKSDSNSSSEDEKKTMTPSESTEEQLSFRSPEADRVSIVPECAYSAWNIFIGIFLLFTTIFLTPGEIPSIVTQCFGVLFIFVGLLAFVLIFKSARSIFIVLTVFSAITIVLTMLTIIGFVYTIDGSFPVPELMLKNTFLEIVLAGLLLFHIVFNLFSFFIFLKRSCKSQNTLNDEHNQRSFRSSAQAQEKQEKGSAEIIVMDY
ncbi:hypothetical protein GCK72_002392 [Caenorhabditis remanei]|uniref:MARVEL domain-containing protein n=1 Tax=Caenorhabditis remanei TaxID=31234 RepID=A0A6A5HW67_CAERE|nr:hypothetical protein GCK72_002392 [Caenorhabditis remanei]KAF1770573.1 hypothetical protein GCK72_002392 [Caenorhabditis remanei]